MIQYALYFHKIKNTIQENMQKFRVDAPKKGASFFCFTMKFCIFVEMPILHVHKKESISLGEKKNRFIEKQNDDF